MFIFHFIVVICVRIVVIGGGDGIAAIRAKETDCIDNICGAEDDKRLKKQFIPLNR